MCKNVISISLALTSNLVFFVGFCALSETLLCEDPARSRVYKPNYKRACRKTRSTWIMIIFRSYCFRYKTQTSTRIPWTWWTKEIKMLVEFFGSDNWTGLYRVMVFGIDRFEQSWKTMVTQCLLHLKTTQNFDVQLLKLNVQCLEDIKLV